MGDSFTRGVAGNVRAEMRRREVSQDVLAPKIGMSQSALSRRLAGHVPFDIAELAAIARALDMPVATLLAHEVAV